MNNTTNIKNYFFYIAATIVIIAGFKAASEVVVILFLAIFIATILSAFIQQLKAVKIPKFIAYILVVIISISFFVLLFYLVNKSLSRFIVDLPIYKEKIINMLGLLGNDFSFNKEEVFEFLNIDYLFSISTKILGGIGSFFSKFLLVLIGVSFILSESMSFEKKLKNIFDNKKEKLENFQLFITNLQKYFIVKTFTSALTGTFVYISLIFLNIEYAILWAILAFLFNFIPVIGSIIASIPALLISLIHNDLNTTLLLGIIYVLVNIVISNVLEPKLMGKKLGLSPMVIFFSLILFGWILGMAGMFLAVPITMTLKIAFESNDSTRWIGVLLSEYKNGNKKG